MKNAIVRKIMAAQQFGRFLIVGGLNTGIDAGFFLNKYWVFNWATGKVLSSR